MPKEINANGKRRRPADDDSETNAVEIRDAEEPFNQATADCILRSSDGMDFRVHKLVLSLASVVFESMFSLPTIKTRSSSSSSQEMRGGLPVIPLPEASLILDSLLRLCYPTSAPDLTQFTHARVLYDAIDKYAMDALAQPVKDALLRTARQDATTAYAFGCRHQISELVVTAAKETLNHPLDHLSSLTMSGTVNANGKRPHVENDSDDDQQRVDDIRDAEAPFNQTTADFILRSADLMDFRVHKAVLSLASPIFETMFSLPKTRSGSSSQEKREGLSVITLPESSDIVDVLLRLCYPTSPPIITQFTLASRLYEAVDKYAMDSLLEPVVHALVETSCQEPLAAYAFGYRHKVKGLVIAAAKETLETPIKDLQHSSELERITGGDLFRLIQYHEDCRKVASSKAHSDRSWIPRLSCIPLATTKQECAVCRQQQKISKDINVLEGMVHSPWNGQERWIFWAPEWWHDYIKRAQGALKVRPRGDTVKSKEVLGPALTAAVACVETTACRSGTQALVDYSELFAKAVEDAIDEVSVVFIA
ncbi:uncharacterized protein STEHIDRAFT_53325 [Stereum hirsutum FP-91666 SS1]|uniref:uncharacterized protein n=1 Tax=Stereum hirsutum (strain FP-91666) TaxID=721885 RepID=UPI000440A79E|nr:uncharacterized protein STEHIDRAFT_53325 [Stereum hirsutum FP-91666 SS1]EIM88779.1 hypothetical protein STEHIDRAFT_53325 [Stereum hirsutum FP-91666 SS1]